MKYLTLVFLTALLSFSSATYAQEKSQPRTKKVCMNEKQKNGKTKEVCKIIKTHKKLDGTTIPNKK